MTKRESMSGEELGCKLLESVKQMRAGQGTVVYSPVAQARAAFQEAEARVREMLMTPIISCPVLGLISAEQCHSQQQTPFTSINPLAVAVYRACRGGCRHWAAKEHDHAA